MPPIRLRGAGLLCAAMLALQGCSAGGHSGALWHLVDAGCNQGRAPIAALTCHRSAGYALLKDRCGPTHYLLIPTARRSGVESAELLRDGEPDYFADAWSERERAIAASGRSTATSDELGLAVNSRWGRSQDQLHIHIDFVRPEVRAALRQWQSEGGIRPRIELLGHPYRIVHVTGLGHPTPFQRAFTPDESAQQRASATIAAVGDGASGFYLLFGQADLLHLNRGHAEELLVPKRCGH